MPSAVNQSRLHGRTAGMNFFRDVKRLGVIFLAVIDEGPVEKSMADRAWLKTRMAQALSDGSFSCDEGCIRIS